MTNLIQTLLFILALVLANGLFAAAEIAVVSVRRSRIRQLVEEGDKRAAAVERLHGNAEVFLATVQVGITVVGALAAAIGGAAITTPLARVLDEGLGFGRASGPVALALVVGGYSYLSIVVGELVPKSLAFRHAERFALTAARPMLGLQALTRPVVSLLTASANLLLKPLKDRTRFTETRLTPEEVRVLIDEAAKVGDIERRRAEIIERAIDFGELTAADVVVPRGQMVVVDVRASTAEIRRVLLEEGYTRMPVVDGSLDKVLGYIAAKDIISLIWEQEIIVLQDIVRPAFFVPTTMPALDLLRALQRRHEHMAIVVDEYGGTAGLCTTEDLVEEIVGEIFSEDTAEPQLVRRLPDGTAFITAILPVREFNREFEADIPEDEPYDTIAGMLTQLAGAIPPLGQTFRAHGFEFLVTDRTERRVNEVRVRRVEPPVAPPA